MEPARLCEYCDNELEHGAKKCHVCEGEVYPDTKINVKLAPIEKSLQLPSKIESECVIPIKSDNIHPTIFHNELSNDRNIRKSDSNHPTNLHNELSNDRNVFMNPMENGKENSPKVEFITDGSVWSCPQCTFGNSSNLLCCSVCFQNRIPDIAVEKDSEQNVPSGWACSYCSFKNDLESLSCSVCEKLKAADPGTNTASENDNKTMEETNESTWICKECSQTNNVSASRCIHCSCHNRKVRICGECNIYSVDEDADTLCNNCLEKRKMITERSASFDIITSGPSYDDDPYTKNRASSLDFYNNKAVMKPSKTSQKKNGFKGLFIKIKDINRWPCKNPNCDKKNSKKLDRCKRCGVSKVCDDEFLKENEADSNAHNSRKNRFMNFSSLSRRKTKKWRCQNSKCNKKNCDTKDNCDSCGRNRYSNDPGIDEEPDHSTNKSHNKHNSKSSKWYDGDQNE